MSPIVRPVLSLYPGTFTRHKEKKASMPTAHAPKKKGHILYRSRGKQFRSTGDSQPRDILRFSDVFLLGNDFLSSILHGHSNSCSARSSSFALFLAFSLVLFLRIFCLYNDLSWLRPTQLSRTVRDWVGSRLEFRAVHLASAILHIWDPHLLAHNTIRYRND
jgi:hypothetical protein